MKTLILLVLAVIAAQSAVIQPTARTNFVVGEIGVEDRLLSRTDVYRSAVTNTMTTYHASYQGNATTWISAIQAIEVQVGQRASVSIIAGGLGSNNATVMFRSARGRRIHYQLSIWGR